MTGSAGRARARRYLSLALWAAVLMAPSAPVAAALLAGGAAAMVGPAAWRAVRRRRARVRAAQPAEAVVLGTDAGGRPVTLGDRQLAAHSLIVGASGAGKSTTLLAVLDAQIRRGQPVIAIDMKGSPGFAAQLEQAAVSAGRRLRVWTPDGPGHWNPLAHGNATSLKDKLISTERFSEPHYQRAAERYVQLALGVLHAAHPGRPAQLHEVVAVMEPRRLGAMLRGVPGPLADQIQDYLAGLTGDQVSAVRGLGTRLALLSESCAGPYLRTGAPDHTIDLRAGLEGGDVILFSLNSSVYGKLAAQLGALVIQDLISATGVRLGVPGAAAGAPPPATVAIDEFSALDGDNLLALLARGREFGVRVLMATQEMADLERAGRGFRDQVAGIVGVKIIHRQDVPASAEMIAQMAGTEPYWEETEHIRGLFSAAGDSRGTRRLGERYVVHPNVIKRLEVGEAVVMTKLPAARVQLVAVRPPPRLPAPHGAQAAVSPPPRLPAPQAEQAAVPPPPPPRLPAAPLRQTSAAPPSQSAGHGAQRRAPSRDYPAPGVTR